MCPMGEAAMHREQQVQRSLGMSGCGTSTEQAIRLESKKQELRETRMWFFILHATGKQRVEWQLPGTGEGGNGEVSVKGHKVLVMREILEIYYTA